MRLYCLATLALAALALTGVADGQQRRLGAEDGDNVGAFRGQPGRRITYVCPARVSIVDMLWGTDVYADTSRICLAALHAGALQPNRAGVVTVVFGGPVEEFRGSVQNNITSRAAAKELTSFRFEGGGAPGLIDAQTTAEGVPADFPTPIVVRCPRDVKPTSTTTVFGTGVYTEDSSICLAAQHAGALAPGVGGAVAVTMVAGETTFLGTKANDVTSGKRDGAMAGFKIAAAAAGATSSAPPLTRGITGLVATVDPQGNAALRWDRWPGATFLAMRWKVDDPTCCNNASLPGAPLTENAWKDGRLGAPGIYRYRLYAHLPGEVHYAETDLAWRGSGPRPPPRGTEIRLP